MDAPWGLKGAQYARAVCPPTRCANVPRRLPQKSRAKVRAPSRSPNQISMNLQRDFTLELRGKEHISAAVGRRISRHAPAGRIYTPAMCRAGAYIRRNKYEREPTQGEGGDERGEESTPHQRNWKKWILPALTAPVRARTMTSVYPPAVCRARSIYHTKQVRARADARRGRSP